MSGWARGWKPFNVMHCQQPLRLKSLCFTIPWVLEEELLLDVFAWADCCSTSGFQDEEIDHSTKHETLTPSCCSSNPSCFKNCKKVFYLRKGKQMNGEHINFEQKLRKLFVKDPVGLPQWGLHHYSCNCVRIWIPLKNLSLVQWHNNSVKMW